MLPGPAFPAEFLYPLTSSFPFRKRNPGSEEDGSGSPVAPPAFGLWISMTAPRSAHSRLSPAHRPLHFMKCLGAPCCPQAPLRGETEAIPGPEIKASMHVPAVCLIRYPWAGSASEPRFLDSGCPLGTSHSQRVLSGR